MKLALVTGQLEPLKRFERLNGVKLDELCGTTAHFEIEEEDWEDCLELAEEWKLTLEEVTANGVLIRIGRSVHCYCGLKLHYVYPHVYRDMLPLIEKLGEYAILKTPEGSFYVPRHFMALHGPFKDEYEDIPDYGFERVVKPPPDRAIIQRPWLRKSRKVKQRKRYRVKDQKYEEKRRRRKEWGTEYKPKQLK